MTADSNFKEKLKRANSRIFILGGHWKTFYDWIRERQIKGSRKERLLDAGCGSGEVKELFDKWGVEIDYHGVDLGIGDINESYRLTAMADLHRLPYKDASFDKIVSISVLEHVDRPSQVMAEFSRVLREGGGAYLHIPFVWHEHQIPQDRFRYPSFGIEHLAKEAGLGVKEILPMGGYFTVLRYMLSNYYFVGEKNSPVTRLFAKICQPIIGVVDRLVAPLVFLLDKLDKEKHLTLGYFVWLKKEGDAEAVQQDPFRCPQCESNESFLNKGDEKWGCNLCGEKFATFESVPKLLIDKKFKPLSDKISGHGDAKSE